MKWIIAFCVILFAVILVNNLNESTTILRAITYAFAGGTAAFSTLALVWFLIHKV